MKLYDVNFQFIFIYTFHFFIFLLMTLSQYRCFYFCNMVIVIRNCLFNQIQWLHMRELSLSNNLEDLFLTKITFYVVISFSIYNFYYICKICWEKNKISNKDAKGVIFQVLLVEAFYFVVLKNRCFFTSQDVKKSSVKRS